MTKKKEKKKIDFGYVESHEETKDLSFFQKLLITNPKLLLEFKINQEKKMHEFYMDSQHIIAIGNHDIIRNNNKIDDGNDKKPQTHVYQKTCLHLPSLKKLIDIFMKAGIDTCYFYISNDSPLKIQSLDGKLWGFIAPRVEEEMD